MTDRKRAPAKDRLKNRSDIGEVEFQIEKLMEFRDASASCVHIEAAMDADRGLTEARKKAPEVIRVPQASLSLAGPVGG